MTKVSRIACGIALPILVAMAAGQPVLACESGERVRLDAPVKLSGVLKEGKGEHEAQGAFRYVYLELDAPLCVAFPPDEAEDKATPQSEESTVSRVQIAGEAANGDLPVGAHVSVAGTLYGAHTMWHAEDVLIDADGVKPAPASGD